jgi:pimeloyl-ACP methyl ester carboxylesterase
MRVRQFIASVFSTTLVLHAVQGEVAHAQSPPGPVSDGLLWVIGPAGQLRASVGGQESGLTPVVFVHSLAGNSSQWTAQLAHLRERRRAVAIDLRGHGESDPAADGDYSLDAMALDVAAVVDHLEIPRFVLVGHSMGGGVIAKYAGSHPDRVAGLLFVDPIGDQRKVRDEITAFVQMLAPETYEPWIESFFTSILANSQPHVREQVLQDLKETPREAVVGVYEGMVTFDPVATLQPYEGGGPMVTIISDFNEFPFSLHNVVPGMESRKMSGTSHWLQIDRPAEFNDYMDEFLASVGR